MLIIGFIKKINKYKLRNREEGGGNSVLVDYQSLRLKYRSIYPPTNYFSLINIHELWLLFVRFIEL